MNRQFSIDGMARARLLAEREAFEKAVQSGDFDFEKFYNPLTAAGRDKGKRDKQAKQYGKLSPSAQKAFQADYAAGQGGAIQGDFAEGLYGAGGEMQMQQEAGRTGAKDAKIRDKMSANPGQPAPAPEAAVDPAVAAPVAPEAAVAPAAAAPAAAAAPVDPVARANAVLAPEAAPVAPEAAAPPAPSG